MWRRIVYHPEVNYALRQTLILCLPVAAGWLAGDLQKGLLFSLVPACCNIAGLDTPHRHFFKRIVIGGTLFALSSFLLQWLLLRNVPLPFIVGALPLLIGVCGEISPLHGRLLPGSLIAMTFTLSLVGRMPLWGPPLLYGCGTLWYGLFNWYWFRLSKDQPLRETLSLLYRALAKYCEEKYTLLSSSDYDKSLPALLNYQQKVVDLITTAYQQIHMLSAEKNSREKYLIRTFMMAEDLQEHISVTLSQSEDVRDLVQKSQSGEIIKRTANLVAGQLRKTADNILYHQIPADFSMRESLSELQNIVRQYPDNPVGQFYLYHFSKIATVLQTRKPLYRRDLMADSQRRLPLLAALRSYISLKSVALRTAGRFSVMLMTASTLALSLNMPKPYWVLMTIILVSQNSYAATRVRIQHRALGTFAGLMIAAWSLKMAAPESVILLTMLLLTLFSNLFSRQYYGWATIGFTVTAVYSLQLLSLNGVNFLVPRLLDTLLGCLIAFAGMLWLWPQWQSALLRKNALDVLETYQHALQILLAPQHTADELESIRIKVNQRHNALFSSMNQAMQEPGFNTEYLNEMHLWVTHSQFIVEHINVLTTLAHEHTMLSPGLARSYLESCEIALQQCQQRLSYQSEDDRSSAVMDTPDKVPLGPVTIMERQLDQILSHLRVMRTISSIVWRQRPRHGQWLINKKKKV
ncbi:MULTISPECIES: YccS/YhfK family putative transporter [Tatumella]|uniref:YccS/YhfK family putative transporter n=1 Tax=Tatumella punctata TaxID=399969 RepID=A0ABW1VNI3_9GAMM|nr:MULTISPECIES: YccS/YhfK family putative transporter [unclassified Tatumella]MBS0876693.1 FUSC family protein [Tatumella sp. JGM82]MBS0889920.1 FUSC family protein [Tatumella sp. JGM94]MBS0901164.1 FUSC family protein [Tatumella sp. JGM100]